jgi:hypothetical protein
MEYSSATNIWLLKEPRFHSNLSSSLGLLSSCLPSPGSVFPSPFSVLRPPFSVLRPPSSVLRSPFSVLRSPVSGLRFLLFPEVFIEGIDRMGRIWCPYQGNILLHLPDHRSVLSFTCKVFPFLRVPFQVIQLLRSVFILN